MQENQTSNNNVELTDIIDALRTNPTFSETYNMNPELLESLYGLAYNFYVSQDYKNSEIIFRALCVYKHNEYRYWMGLAGCKQALEEYAAAVDAYNFAGMVVGMKSPIPLFYSAHCYLRMGDKESALKALGIAAELDTNNNEEYKNYKVKAEEFFEAIVKTDN